MNPTLEQQIQHAQTKAQLPELIRRGRQIDEHIADVVRGLFQLGHRVIGLRMPEIELQTLRQYLTTQAGQRLGGHGYLHDEIGYIPVSSGGATLTGHVSFELPGSELPGGHDLLTVFANPDERTVDTLARFRSFKDGHAVAAIIKTPAAVEAPDPEGEQGEVQAPATDASPELIARANAAGIVAEPGDTASDVLTKLGENAYATGGVLPAGSAPAIVSDNSPEVFTPKDPAGQALTDQAQADELARTMTEDGQTPAAPADAGTAEADVPANQSVNPDAAAAQASAAGNAASE